MTSKPTFMRVLAISAVAATLCVIDPGGAGLQLRPREAHAVVGRPLTPVSYAGVARRTTRRAVYRGAAYGGAYATPYAASTVTVLPSGCTRADAGGVYYACGGARYQPYYDGPNVVYRVVP